MCIVYSYGLGADWSFDIAAEAVNCEVNCIDKSVNVYYMYQFIISLWQSQVHGFDPTGLLWRQGMHGSAYANIDYSTQYPSKLKKFHNWGIGAADRAVYPPGSIPQEWPGLGDPQLSKSNPEPWEMRSIEQTMSDLGHNTITILKIDVEGAEWDAIGAFLSSEKMQKMVANGGISQLLMEWHWDPDSRARNGRHEQILRKVEEMGFLPWKVTRHEGSDCCLDVSYIWKQRISSLDV